MKTKGERDDMSMIDLRIFWSLLWAIGFFWCWYMVGSNNRYQQMRAGDEKNTLCCNMIVWFFLMVYCLVRCVKLWL